MKKITVLGAIHPDAMALAAARSDVALEVIEEVLPPRAEMAAACEGAHGIALRSARLDPAFLAAIPELMIVARHGVGCDNVAVDWMTENGKPVAITAGANDRSVAEHTLGMMLSLARDFEPQTRALREADWGVRSRIAPYDLFERTLLVVGCGRIGGRVARLGTMMGMTVLAVDPYINDFPEGVEPVTLAEGLARADIVTVHTPLNDETRDLIDRDAIAAMRPGTILINNARGGICNEPAVAGALQAGDLRGYGVDVFSVEPVSPDNPIVIAPNVLMSPHCASMTPQGLRAMATVMMQNILDCFDGCLKPEMVFNRKELGL